MLIIKIKEIENNNIMAALKIISFTIVSVIVVSTVVLTTNKVISTKKVTE